MDWPLLRAVPEGDRREILSRARRRKFARGEILFHEGDPADSLHIISRGRVAIGSSTALGDVATFAILGPGEAFGELALLRKEAHRTASATALEPTETHSIYRTDFEELRRSHPQVERFLTEVLAQRVERLSAHLLEALYVPVGKRVLRRLHALADTYGVGKVGTVIPLTQDDLASLAGTSRPTANRIIREAEDEGLLTLGRRRITILDPDRLAKKAR